MNKCKKIVKHQVLFRKWEEEVESHKWIYDIKKYAGENRHFRLCADCKKCQILFGTEKHRADGYEWSREDWRDFETILL